MKSYKFTLFAWFADDEGGYGICQFGKFKKLLGYDPKSGWRAKPSEKIGDFNTIDELARLILKDASSYCDDYHLDDAEREAAFLMNEYNGVVANEEW